MGGKAAPGYGKAYYAANKERGKRLAKEWYAANQSKARDSRLRRVFGLSAAAYDEMLLNQGGRCAICGSDNPRRKTSEHFSVDHDHETGAVRALLCGQCNFAIGHLGDSSDRALAVAAYLEKHGR